MAKDFFHQVVKEALNIDGVQEPDRLLYLAIPSQTYDEFFRLRFVQEGVAEYQMLLMVYDSEQRRIEQWIK